MSRKSAMQFLLLLADELMESCHSLMPMAEFLGGLLIFSC